MATATGNGCCVVNCKGKFTFKCGGCLQNFCYKHVADHRHDLYKQLDEIEVNCDVLRQKFEDRKKLSSIKEIDQWELESINKIRQIAEEARQLVIGHTTENMTQMEVRLNKLTEQLRQSREENEFFETDLNQWEEELKRLTEELAQLQNIKFQVDPISFENKIYASVTPINETLRNTNIGAKRKWVQNGITVAGGNGQGSKLNQLCHPFGIYIDDDQTVYIADRGNHRIMAWKHGAKSGQIVAGSCREGNGIDQLYYPTDVIINNANDSLIISDSGNRRVVERPHRSGTSGQIIISNIECYGLAMDNNGCLYVSDTEKNEVRLFRVGDAHGTIVAGGNGRGNRLNQFNYPTHLFVDHEYSLFVSDLFNHRVMKWMKGAKEGIAVVCDRDLRSGLTQLFGPRGVMVDPLGNVYVTDDNNHRVMLWYNRVTQSCIIAGGNGKGKQANQLDGSTGLSFDRQGNLYVVDYGNDRVQRFDILSHDRYLVIDNE